MSPELGPKTGIEPCSPFYTMGVVPLIFPNWSKQLLAGDLFLSVGLTESSQLYRGGMSGLGKPAQGGLTTIGTFNYFAGDDPAGPVFLATSWKK
jgi:hypothetical protein